MNAAAASEIMSLHQETVLNSGHIIDSLLLARVLNTILMMGGAYDLKDVHIRNGETGYHGGLCPTGVPVVMAGTIRDYGLLPGVINDYFHAQNAMRAAIPVVRLALLVASTLHSVATGNLLPATVPTVCVDVNPSVPTKLADRGSFQVVSLVMDAASFLSEFARILGRPA